MGSINKSGIAGVRLRLLFVALTCFLTTSCATGFTAFIVSRNSEGRLVNQMNPPSFATEETCAAWLRDAPETTNEVYRFCGWQLIMWPDEVLDDYVGSETPVAPEDYFVEKELRKRAKQGDPDAQWQLYQMQPIEDNLVWLCRAADQGQVSARNELGELYFYGSGHYRKFKNVHIPSDLSRSCMWFDLADYAQIIAQPKTSNILLVSGSYKSSEVERTARAMTAHELIEAEHLILTWEPGQCDRDIPTHLNVPYAERSGIAELCAAADKGSFSARAKLGQIYYLGSKDVEPDLPRAYMWYLLADKVYVPPGLDERLIQTRCNAMTPKQRYIAIKLLEEWKPGKCEQDLLEYRE